VAVQSFLERRSGFLDIERVVEATLANLSHSPLDSLDDVRHIDAEARRVARELLARQSDRH